jgi:putative protease
MSDPGLIMLVRQHFPQMPIHLSVQANTVNWASVQFWQQMGLTRVILSRELSLEEIEEIRQQVPQMELEVFVHGALCMAYSGRCLLSGYLNKRDANQGTCTNACRWKYQATPATENATGDIVREFEPTLGLGAPTDQVFLLQESNRPGEEMPAFEDEHGTYIMNAKDLRAIQHVERLAQMGVHSLKIEGRTKSHFYCARGAVVPPGHRRRGGRPAVRPGPDGQPRIPRPARLHRGFPAPPRARRVPELPARQFGVRAPAVRGRADRRAG